MVSLSYFDSIQQGTSTKNPSNNFKQHLKQLLFHACFDTFKSISKNSMIKYLEHQLFRLRAPDFLHSVSWESPKEDVSSLPACRGTCLPVWRNILLSCFHISLFSQIPLCPQQNRMVKNPAF